MEGMRIQMQWKGGTPSQEDNRKLIGRVISDTKIGVGAVKEQVMAAWKLKSRLDVNVLGFNLFSFNFENPMEAKRVLEDSPWVVRQHMLSLEKRKPFLSDSEIQIKTCGFWVQFHDIPPEGLLAVNIQDMAGKIGQVIKIENPEEERYARRSFCRARVEVYIDKPLIPLFFVPRPGGLPEAGIKVKYEKLVKFCYICGRLGHDERACSSEDDDDPSSEPRKIFDASMCAQSFRMSTVAPAKVNSGWQGSQSEGNKKVEEIGVWANNQVSDIVPRMEREVQKPRELEGVGNNSHWESFIIGGKEDKMEQERDPHAADQVGDVVMSEENRRSVERIIIGLREVDLGPKVGHLLQNKRIF